MNKPHIHHKNHVREELYKFALAPVVVLIALMGAALGMLCSPPFAVALSAVLAIWLGVHVHDDPRIVVKSRPHPAKRFAIIAAVATPIGVAIRALAWPGSVQKDDALWGLGLLVAVCVTALAWCYQELRSSPGPA